MRISARTLIATCDYCGNRETSSRVVMYEDQTTEVICETDSLKIAQRIRSDGGRVESDLTIMLAKLELGTDAFQDVPEALSTSEASA